MIGLERQHTPIGAALRGGAFCVCLALVPLPVLAQTSPAALLDETGAAVSTGRYVDALAAFTSAIAAAPDDAVAHTRRAQLFDQLGHYDLAAADYRVAAKASTTDASLHKSLCLDLALANHDLDGALAACNTAVRLAPGNVDALSARGYLQLRRGAYAEAEKDFSATLALSPAAPSEMFGLGVAMIHLGKVKEGRGEIASATLDSAGVVSDWQGRGFGMQGEIVPGKVKTTASQPATSLKDPKVFLNKGEAYVRLVGGCGRVAEASAADAGASWSGECRFGLLHGAGKLTSPGGDGSSVRFAYGREIGGEAGSALEKKLSLAYHAAEEALTP